MATEREQLQAGIDALECQRALLGDAAAEVSSAPLRAKLAALAAATLGLGALRVNRRKAIAAGLSSVGAVLRSESAIAQSPAAPRRLGTLGWLDAAGEKENRDRLVAELAKLGWIEGRRLAISSLYANGDSTRMDILAKELVSLRPDAIVVVNTPAALALQRATRTVPIVFVGPVDPVKLGLVSSLSRPGGNITGITGESGFELIGKRLQLLKELLPSATSLAVLYNPLELENLNLLAANRRYAAELGMRVEELGARDTEQIEASLANLKRDPPDAVVVIGSALMITNGKMICNRLTAARIPSTSARGTFIEAGCLFGYLRLIGDFAKEAARYVDEIFHGANPADIPVSQPTRYELVVNGKTAKELGLKLPPSLLSHADRVIE